MRNNICSICKQKNLSIDFSKIKILKIKKFINNNRINQEDFLNMIKKCNCNEMTHKFCILLNILFNYEIKCQNCNSFYNIVITKESDKLEKCKIFLLMIYFFFIHLILYGICAFLIVFDINKNEFSDFNFCPNLYLYSQYFFAFILFVLNTYLFYKTIKSIISRFKQSYKFFININEKCSNNIDDSKYFKPLYDFYRYFNKDRLRYLVYKRNGVFFGNKFLYNKDFQNLIKKNNIEFQNISNGNRKFSIQNNINNNEDILKLKDSYDNKNNNINNKIMEE